ncbi:hypothetical protein, partial [Treponema sp.]|uniref:hypothetical protein n=1 Tax=Treponema sp. TaxID=166 RepID=UPI00388FF310
MIYAFVNIAFALFLGWMAFFVDTKTGNEGKNPVISLNVLLALACGAVGLTILVAFSGIPERVSFFFGSLAFIFFGMYSVSFAVYCIFYPAIERPAVAQLLTWGGWIWCVWAVFFHFTGVIASSFIGFRVESISLFMGNLAAAFPYNWYDFYSVIVFFVLPFFSVIIMLLRSENRDSRLDHQKTVMNTIGLVLAWLCLALISLAYNRVAMFSSL